MKIRNIRVYDVKDPTNDKGYYEVKLEHEKTVQDVYDSILKFEEQFNSGKRYWELRIHEELENKCNSWVLITRDTEEDEVEDYNGPLRIPVDRVEVDVQEGAFYSFDIYLKI